jgi:putative Mg2+ transporter-C (MgtC) family protein
MPGTLECLLRLALSAVFGGAIGLERELRLKGAGVRTHLIVCFAACMMMLVSKYGFMDMLEFASANGYDIMKLDPSRIAAGLWATVGIGMTVGAGMYAISAFGAAFIVVIQAVLYRDHVILGHVAAAVFIHLDDAPDSLERLLAVLKPLGIAPDQCRYERRDDILVVELHLSRLPCPSEQLGELLAPLMGEPYIKSVRW